MNAINKRLVIAIILSILCLGLNIKNSHAAKNTGVVTSVTFAKIKIYKGNLPQAKKRAVSNALDQAVQNALASLLSREVLASSLDVLYERLLSKSLDYIITYRVLTGLDRHDYYLAAVESKVDLKRIEKFLTKAKIINTQKDKPGILFFISEKSGDDILPKYWWGNNPIPYESVAEKIIVEGIAENQFPIAGADLDHPDPSFYNIVFSSIYDTKAAMDLGREFDADMVIMGRVTASETVNRMGEDKTYNAIVFMEGFSLATNEKVVVSKIEAAVKSDNAQTGFHEAIVKAANQAVPDLSDRIDQFWTLNLKKEHLFDVLIEGNEFLVRFIELKKRFNQMPNIENMQPKELGSGNALLEIKYKGSPSQFANNLMLKTFDNFGIEILEVTSDQVSIEFIEKFDPALEEAVPALEIPVDEVTKTEE
ncbi:MAG: hypothetical protein GY729_13370 [Desulfobacteraceae bacterium]|nr:hypothetical protein [Desulfobacteraceae bacterium]